MSRSREGYALVGVLVFSLLIMPLIALFAQSAHVAAKSMATTNASYKLSLMAEGLGLVAAARLSNDKTFLARLANMQALSCLQDRAVFTFVLRDHDGKISLNSAEGKLLKAGFKAAGLNDAQADALDKFVEASRQQSSSAANLPEFGDFPLKFAPFERVEELNDAVAALKAPPVDFSRIFSVIKTTANIEIENADPALKAILANEPALRSEVSAKDNESFETIDLRITARESIKAQPRLNLVQTYSAAPSGVIAVASKRSWPVDQILPLDQNTLPSCDSFLGLSGDADG